MFFTFPYPKFKLLVKGFYGKPVTFQLTCSKFTGSFNSQMVILKLLQLLLVIIILC